MQTQHVGTQNTSLYIWYKVQAQVHWTSEFTRTQRLKQISKKVFKHLFAHGSTTNVTTTCVVQEGHTPEHEHYTSVHNQRGVAKGRSTLQSNARTERITILSKNIFTDKVSSPTVKLHLSVLKFNVLAQREFVRI